MRHDYNRHRVQLSGLACGCAGSGYHGSDLAGLDGLGSSLKKIAKKVTNVVKKAAPIVAPIAGAVVGGPVGLQLGAQIGAAFAPSADTAPPPDMYVQQAPIQTVVPAPVAAVQPAAAGSFNLGQFVEQNKMPLMIGGGLLFLVSMSRGR